MSFRRINSGTGHRYEDADGSKLPGVTTILEKGTPKPALKAWAARSIAEWTGDNLADLATMSPSAATKAALDAFYGNRNKALDYGTAFHNAAERLAKGQTIEPEPGYEGIIDTFVQWWHDYRVEPIAVEAPVVSRRYQHGYAGTVDLVANVLGHLALIDYKTGKRIYPESALQLAAYANADAYLTADGTEEVMPLAPEEEPSDAKPDGTARFELVAALWVQDDRYELRPVDAGADTYLAFRYAYGVARFGERDNVIAGPLSPFDCLHLGVAS